MGSVEDADAVINYFNNTVGQRITVSYSEKSAKDFNKPCESNKANDDFYLSLFKDPRFSISFTSELYTTICIYNIIQELQVLHFLSKTSITCRKRFIKTLNFNFLLNYTLHLL